MDLCANCKAFDIQYFSRYESQEAGFSWRPPPCFPVKAFEESAYNGCHFCRFILQRLKDNIAKAREVSWIQRLLPKLYRGPFVFMLMGKSRAEFRFLPNQDTNTGLDCDTLIMFIRNFPIPGEFYDGLPLIRDIEDYPAKQEFRIVAEMDSAAASNGDITGIHLGNGAISDGYCRLIGRWLENCTKTHNSCRDLDDTDISMPTRCIDVRPESPLLATTAGLKERYIIVSHRWSDETEASKTVLANLTSRQEGIQWTELPKFAQDTIMVAKKLGIDYVWIDSLCIIQGGEDWAAEAPRMAEYYSNATFTLMISTSENRGCFFARPEMSAGTLARLPYRDPNGAHKGFIYFHENQEEPLFSNYEQLVVNSDLFKRGWVFQERYLSRRVVHFTNGMMFLECLTGNPINEWNKRVHIKYVETRYRFLRPPNQSQSVHPSTMPSADWSVNLRFWYETVSEYTKLELTKPAKDRLIAISGIAKRFMKSFELDQLLQGQNITYICGLWYHDLAAGLLWEHIGNGEPMPSGCQVPTWSWAFYKTPVGWNNWRLAKPDLNLWELDDLHLGKRQTHCEISEILAREPMAIDSVTDNTREQMTVRSDAEIQLASFIEGKIYLGIKLPYQRVSIDEQIEERYIRLFRKWTKFYLGPDSKVRLNRRNWRAVYFQESERDRWVIGWASIENPTVRDILANQGQANLIAGCISSNIDNSWAFGFGPAHGFGGLFKRHRIVEVLYLHHIEGNVYERAGVGRIFEPGFLENAEELDIKLV